ncbi:MAG: hypothetical protein AB1898_03805 [Acidobacteriota bacterium]
MIERTTIMKKQKGFSAIDLLITVAIATIVLGFILPSINQGLQSYRLNASAQEIAAQIQSVRYRALRDNAVCSFLILPSGRSFGVDANANGSLTGGSGDIVLALQNGINFTAASVPPPSASGSTTLSTGSLNGIGFTPRGGVTAINSSTGLPDFNPASVPAGGYAIYLLGPGNKFAAITVSTAGRVRTWRGNGATWN